MNAILSTAEKEKNEKKPPLLPLTAENLSKNTRAPKPPSVYYIGIHFRADDDNNIRYNEQKRKRWKDMITRCSITSLNMNLCFSNNPYWVNDYRCMNFCNDNYTLHKRAPDCIERIPAKVWENDIVRELLKLIDEAQSKQKYLNELLYANPKASTGSRILSKIAPIMLYLVLFQPSWPTTTSTDPFIDSCNPLVKVVWIVIYYLWLSIYMGLFQVFWVTLLMFLSMFCCLDICNKKDDDIGIRFLEALYEQYPNLDFDAIEDDIANGVKELTDSLNNIHLRNLPYEASCHLGLETIHHPRNGSEGSYDTEEAFYIISFTHRFDKV